MGGPGGERATTSDTMMQLGRDGAGLLFHVGGVVRPRRQELVGLLQPNVKLVDINETPIERITPTGIKTSDADYEFDIIIYATGFDAITGSFDRIDFRGVDGVSLKEKWKDGPQTFLGILVDGFPNMLIVMSPHAGLGNFPRAAEYSADWVTGLIRFARDRGLTASRPPRRVLLPRPTTSLRRARACCSPR
jgi:cation diffusion facilitator CzcD-associated flavoprotein CzcO